MVELIFGIFWTIVSVLMLVLAWSAGGLVIAFMLVFVVVGLFLVFTGLKKVLANRATNIYGVETYGIVVDVRPSGTRINDRPVLNADVVIVEESGVTGRYTESIGTSYNKYRVGEYVLVKYHNDDINIINRADISIVPQYIKDKLQSEGYMAGTAPYISAGFIGGYTPGSNGGYLNYNQGYQDFNHGYQNYNQGYQHINQGYQQTWVNGEYQQGAGNNDTIVIDGVEYVKKQ